jgi:biopolymer transport protein ExbD
MIKKWDVFHCDRLEIERSLDEGQVREAVRRGELTADDLIRPEGSSTSWARLIDFPGLLEPLEPGSRGAGTPDVGAAGAFTQAVGPAPTGSVLEPDAALGSMERVAGEFPPIPSELESVWVPPARADDVTVAMPCTADEDFAPPSFEDVEANTQEMTQFDLDVEEPQTQGELSAADDPAHDTYLDALIDEDDDEDLGELDLSLDRDAPAVALPLERQRDKAEEYSVDGWDVDEEAEYDPQDEDEAVAEFTLARGRTERVEELDLAAMVDVAFQMVLFFMVTATTVLYKTLEVPKPNPENAPSAAASQGQGRSLEDLQETYILVDIDPQGGFKIDHEPVPARMPVLVDRLRTARQNTGRLAMLLTADATALHKYAVLAYDAANEIGLRIAIARPSDGGGVASR